METGDLERLVEDNPEWLLARWIRNLGRDYIGGDSRPELDALGFRNIKEFRKIKEYNPLFYLAQPPDGWTKSTEGNWTIFVDPMGNERIFQFYSPQRGKAFLNITTLTTSTTE